MPTASFSKTYSDGNLLSASDLDAFINDMETLFNTTKLDDTNIQADGISGNTKIADDTIVTAKLAATTVEGSSIATNAITAAKLKTDSITSSEVGALSIPTAAIVNDAVITAKLADDAVENDNIPDTAITRAKLATLTAQISAASGSFITTSTSFTDVTNLSVTISNTQGRPVMLFLQPNGVNPAYIGSNNSGGVESHAQFKFLRDGVGIQLQRVQGKTGNAGSSMYIPPGSLWAIDTPANGSYTYKIQIKSGVSGGEARVHNCKLVGYIL